MFRVAAEWIIRNGGRVKFESNITWSTNYSTLPNSLIKLVAIDGSNIGLTSSGLKHLSKDPPDLYPNYFRKVETPLW